MVLARQERYCSAWSETCWMESEIKMKKKMGLE